MSFRSNGLVFAMENEGEEIVASDDTTVAEATAETEANVAEVNDNVAEVQDMTDSVDAAVTDAGTLENIEGVMEESVESGEGMPEEAAEIAEVAIEAICNRLGIVNSKIVPATESFGSSNTRLQATKVALENIGETLKRIWVAIKGFFIKVWEKIKQVWNSFFNSTASVTKYLKSIRNRVDELPSGYSTKEKEFENSSLAKQLSIKGKASADTIKTLFENHQKFVKFSTGFINQAPEVTSEVLSSIKEVESTKDKMDENGAKKIINSVVDSLKAIKTIAGDSKPLETKDLDKLSKGESYNKDLSFQYGPLIGNTYATQVVVNSDAGKKLSLDFNVSSREDAKAGKLSVLSKSQMSEMIEKALEAIVQIEKDYKNNNKLDAINKQFINITDSVIKYASHVKDDTESNKHTRDVLMSLKGFTTSANNSFNKLITAIPSLDIKLAKAVGTYVSQSLSLYKASEK